MAAGQSGHCRGQVLHQPVVGGPRRVVALVHRRSNTNPRRHLHDLDCASYLRSAMVVHMPRYGQARNARLFDFVGIEIGVRISH
jgi:hypothetical protein